MKARLLGPPPPTITPPTLGWYPLLFASQFFRGSNWLKILWNGYKTIPIPSKARKLRFTIAGVAPRGSTSTAGGWANQNGANYGRRRRCPDSSGFPRLMDVWEQRIRPRRRGGGGGSEWVVHEPRSRRYYWLRRAWPFCRGGRRGATGIGASREWCNGAQVCCAHEELCCQCSHHRLERSKRGRGATVATVCRRCTETTRRFGARRSLEARLPHAAVGKSERGVALVGGRRVEIQITQQVTCLLCGHGAVFSSLLRPGCQGFGWRDLVGGRAVHICTFTIFPS